VICPDHASDFQVPTGHALVGYTMLANISTLDAVIASSPNNDTAANKSVADSRSCTNGSCHSTAIGAGVAVPLGVIALASLIWASFERKKGKGITRSFNISSDDEY
jgi:predicted CxxxxCH...CXXCH cytochrome family protein